MCELCGILSADEGSASGDYAGEESHVRLRATESCVTFPVFTGGLSGSFKFSVRWPSRPQRFSSTAVYPPCPLTLSEKLDGHAFGHGGYTASGWATT